MNKFVNKIKNKTKKLKAEGERLKSFANCENEKELVSWYEKNFKFLSYGNVFEGIVKKHYSELVKYRDELRKSSAESIPQHLQKCVDPSCKHTAHESARRSAMQLCDTTPVIMKSLEPVMEETKMMETMTITSGKASFTGVADPREETKQ